jgi:DNA-binding NarL/FixJ family response regulator
MKHGVYIVDDHPLVREFLAQLIERQHDLAVCGQAADPASALEGIGATRPEMAIVDLSLETRFGLDLIRDIGVLHPDTAVLVLSMHEDAHYVERAFRAGARGYVSKREATAGVVPAIRRVLSGHAYLSDRLAAAMADRLAANHSGAGQTPLMGLSDRELEVFHLVGRGLGSKEIAASLHICQKTVQAYQARMKAKLGLRNACQLLREAVRWADDAACPAAG